MSKKPPLPHGWTVHISKTHPDRVFYYNVLTGSTTWVLPVIKDDANQPPSPSQDPQCSLVAGVHDASGHRTTQSVEEQSRPHSNESSDCDLQDYEIEAIVVKKPLKRLKKARQKHIRIPDKDVRPLKPAIKSFLDNNSPKTKPKAKIRFSESNEIIEIDRLSTISTTTSDSSEVDIYFSNEHKIFGSQIPPEEAGTERSIAAPSTSKQMKWEQTIPNTNERTVISLNSQLSSNNRSTPEFHENNTANVPSLVKNNILTKIQKANISLGDTIRTDLLSQEVGEKIIANSNKPSDQNISKNSNSKNAANIISTNTTKRLVIRREIDVSLSSSSTAQAALKKNTEKIEHGKKDRKLVKFDSTQNVAATMISRKRESPENQRHLKSQQNKVNSLFKSDSSPMPPLFRSELPVPLGEDAVCASESTFSIENNTSSKSEQNRSSHHTAGVTMQNNKINLSPSSPRLYRIPRKASVLPVLSQGLISSSSIEPKSNNSLYNSRTDNVDSSLSLQPQLECEIEQSRKRPSQRTQITFDTGPNSSKSASLKASGKKIYSDSTLPSDVVRTNLNSKSESSISPMSNFPSMIGSDFDALLFDDVATPAKAVLVTKKPRQLPVQESLTQLSSSNNDVFGDSISDKSSDSCKFNTEECDKSSKQSQEVLQPMGKSNSKFSPVFKNTTSMGCTSDLNAEKRVGYSLESVSHNALKEIQMSVDQSKEDDFEIEDTDDPLEESSPSHEADEELTQNFLQNLPKSDQFSMPGWSDLAKCNIESSTSENNATQRSFGLNWSVQPSSGSVETMEWEANDSEVTSGNSSSCVEDMNQHCWHIVIDTNILLHELDFVGELRDSLYKDRTVPILVIPWVVLQELDNLKNPAKHKNVDGKLVNPSLFGGKKEVSQPIVNMAIAAISFMHTNLDSGHPRFKVQPYSDYSQHKYLACVNNDDKIIHYCSSLQKQGLQVTLLSHDKHLRNKALASRIEAVTKSTLQMSLEKVSIIASLKKELSTKKPNQEKSATTTNAKMDDALQADQFLCETKTILLPILTQVLQKQMKKTFKEMWERMVIRKPPWTLDDVIFCIKKHWMAALSSCLPPDAKLHIETIDEICHQHKRKGFGHNHADVKKFLEVTKSLLMCFASIRNLKYEVETSMEKINVMLCACTRKLSNDDGSSPEADENMLFIPQSTRNFDASSIDMSETPTPGDQIMAVENRLLYLWEDLNRFCINLEMLMNGGGAALLDEIENEIGTKLRLAKLVSQLNQKILSKEPSECTSAFKELHSILVDEIATKIDVAPNIEFTVDALQEYCKSNRNSLEQAQTQFQGFISKLNSGVRYLMTRGH